MPLDLYYVVGSPPCAAVLQTAKVLGIELNVKYMDYEKKEHLTPEFKKINPQHTVPTIDDNGFILWESRAIMQYLVNRYSKNSPLYPEDPKKRALIDQRLYYDMTLYGKLAEYYYPPLFFNESFDPEKLTKLKDYLKYLETFLGATKFAAGDTMTLADLALATTVTVLELMGFHIEEYPKVTKWFQDLKKSVVGYEDSNGRMVERLQKYFETLLVKPVN